MLQHKDDLCKATNVNDMVCIHLHPLLCTQMYMHEHRTFVVIVVVCSYKVKLLGIKYLLFALLI